MKVPKIVGMGMSGVFELIRETKTTHPVLCGRALQSLLDILQGQTPEGLSKEPPLVIDCLFELLMELTTDSDTGNSVPDGHQSLSSLGCSSLLSLVVARGDTGKLLTAITALLRSNTHTALQAIKIPLVLGALQKSVQSVILGKTLHPTWLSSGVTNKALLDSFNISHVPTDGKQEGTYGAIASDGSYLYIHNSLGLFKVGTGYNSTIKGHVYKSRSDFHTADQGWLSFVKGLLFYQYLGSRILMNINIETLEEERPYEVTGESGDSCVMFTNGDTIGEISAGKDDGFVIRSYSPLTSPMPCVNELPFKLARKCLLAFGQSTYDSQKEIHTLCLGMDEDPLTVNGGKDFSLIRTATGKMLYIGKPVSLGLKQGGGMSNKWSELPITKSPKITQCSVGHEGQHSILITDDGTAFFVGTSKRGEDGDQVKSRRLHKVSKPKKISKMDGKCAVHSACNNGSSALVTKQGEMYIFGKDNTYADHSTGLVTDLKDVQVSSVSLGKAHACVLASNGDVYTFGINNKGQCGRDYGGPSVKEGLAQAAAMSISVNDEDNEEDEIDGEESHGMCPSGSHKWKHEQCMVCTICGECTGYGPSCISTGGPDRVTGALCGCGTGDAGCTKCGCCKTCAGEGQDKEFSGGWLEALARHGELLPLDILAKKQIEDRRRYQPIGFRQIGKVLLDADQGSASGDDNKDHDKDQSKTVTHPPSKILIGIGDVATTQISCGLHHTVVLLQNGDVYAFGSGQYGQLGQGDTSTRGAPTLVVLPVAASHVAAGSNHTVVLLENGQVFTFGSHQKGQLGRAAPGDEQSCRHWYAEPGLVPGIGAQSGRRATWIGASGDQTYMKVDESLINANTLAKCKVFSNHKSIGLIPTDSASTVKCLMISGSDGNCKSFSGPDQVTLKDRCICLDPVYDVLWSYDPLTSHVCCYNVLTGDAHDIVTKDSSERPSILNCEFTIPCQSDTSTTRAHCALNLLCCLDTLTTSQDVGIVVAEQRQDFHSTARVFTKDDFTIVNRFESHGGGWGYSGHSVEAIRFTVDCDVVLGGLGLFGGRGEYTAKIKVYELGVDGGDHESDGDLLAESDDTSYECGAREKFPVLFDEPVLLCANIWYVAWARVSGPSSDCGSGGIMTVTSDDQVVFRFKSSKKSNNGTDVNAGQIPQILYRLPLADTSSGSNVTKEVEPIHILSRQFSRTVSSACFDSLLNLLEWSWATFNKSLLEIQSLKGTNLTAALLDLNRLVYLSTASLRLLKIYTCEVYPNGSNARTPPETETLADCVGKTRTLLCKILSEKSVYSIKTRGKDDVHHNDLLDMILLECHHTFVNCFHAFYPTNQLKWICLCDLLSQMNPEDKAITNCFLLAAVLEALCHPSVKLTNLLPIVRETEAASLALQRQLSNDDNASCATLVGEHIRYPLLVSNLEMTLQVDGCSSMGNFREVLAKLMSIIVLPVRHSLKKETCTIPPLLVSNACSLLACIVSELAASATGSENDIQSTGRPILTTPTRFARVSQGRSWNTGNGSPDAVCFSVDRSGVIIIGFGVFGGLGQYEYELELLDDIEGSSDGHNHRWNSLEIIKGTYGADDCVNDVAEIRFERPVPIKEGVKYAVRLRNHGNRTSNGDGGLAQIKGPDGSTFTFSSCSLSSNGTNHTRGQLPTVLYQTTPNEGEVSTPHNSQAAAEMQSRNNAITITSAIIKSATDILERAQSHQNGDLVELLGSVHLFSSLLPLVLASIAPVASTDPRSAVQVLSLIEEILPSVAGVNLHSAPQPTSPSSVLSGQQSDCSTLSPTDSHAITTSTHYAIVESEHPYKPASVTSYKVSFSEAVQWMTLEFDPQCGTAQPEDSVKLYIPNKSAKDDQSTENPLIPVLKKFYGGLNWPSMAVILPGVKTLLVRTGCLYFLHVCVLCTGNEVHFTLETASDYVKDEKASFYGFKCTVIGYEWVSAPEEGMAQLEKELSYLGGMCASSLLKKDLILPPTTTEEAEEDLDALEETIFSNHSTLLNKAFALSSPLTVHQALDGNIPICTQSNERAFLKDFVSCSSATSGGRLARWIQPDSYVDPKQCDILFDKDNIKCSWPAVITLQTRDQYADLVHVPNLKVEAKAVPVIRKDNAESNTKYHKSKGKSLEKDMTYGGHPTPKIDTLYEPTATNHVNYISITMMKEYENYSFEELRIASPIVRRPDENMLVRANNDGSYHANWTPGSAGTYAVHVTIDGYPMDDVPQIEVGEPPQGVTPPNPAATKKPHQPSKVRKYVASHSQGLRIRTSPSLQSEQIGIVGVNDTITFVDEVHNEDGVWLRLNSETIHKYCGTNGYKEAWCLSYNQHLGKTLLVPVELKSSEGNIWVKLDHESMQRYCESTEGEAWSLARNKDAIYLMHEADLEIEEEKAKLTAPFALEFTSGRSTPPKVAGFDFKKAAATASSGPLMFGGHASNGLNGPVIPNVPTFGSPSKNEIIPENQTGPFVFGQAKGPSFPFGQGAASSNESATEQVEKKFVEKIKDSLDKSSQGIRLLEDAAGTPSSSGHDSLKGHFSIGRLDGRSSPQRSLSPKTLRKTKTGKRERTSSPAPKDKPPARSRSGSFKASENRFRESFKQAVSASVAETARSVFASFLWHEGIVHDAMACASFLKFHPGLSKQATSLPQPTPEPVPTHEKLKNRYSADFSQSMPESAIASLQDPELLAKLCNGNKEVDGTSSGGSASPRESPRMSTSSESSPRKGHSSPKKASREASPKTLSRDSSPKRSIDSSPKKTPSESMLKGSPKKIHVGIVAESDKQPSESPLRGSPKKTPVGVIAEADKTRSPRKSPKHSPKVSPKSSPKPSPKSSPLLSRKAKQLTTSSDVFSSGRLHTPSVTPRERSASTSKTDGLSLRDSQTMQNNIKKDLAPESALPPTLKHLVSFWEDLSSAVLNVAAQQIVLPSPAVIVKSSKTKNDKKDRDRDRSRKDKKKREKAPLGRGNLFGEAAGVPIGAGERESVCELCDGVFPHPVTYHMRQNHPGCGRHAGGQGYNSSGNFCGGWAGNCGDGGRGGSSWYLMCDRCREKYLKEKRSNASKEKVKKLKKKPPPLRVSKVLPPVEAHHIMKANALFLLDLASAAGPLLPSSSPVKKQSKFDLPVLSEMDLQTTSEFPHSVPFQFLKMLRGEHHSEMLPLILRDVEMFTRDGRLEASINARNDMLPQSDLDGRKGGGSSTKERPKSAIELDPRRMPFQRSISMTNNVDDESAKVIIKPRIQRRRNNSGSTTSFTEGGSSLLRRPSPALAKLVGGGNNEKALQRPVISFIMQRYDLEGLKIAMKQAVRKAACRVHAMQALNWLLRNVTQATCLHDLLWHFVSSLMPVPPEKEEETAENNKKDQPDPDKDVIMCDHPLADITIGGESINPLGVAFHSLLQTISDIMMLLPHGSALQLMAIRCWCLRFRPSDHVFLHHSHVFSNISKILSKSDEGDTDDVMLNSSASFIGEIVLPSEQSVVTVSCLKDLTSVADIQVSSRAAMLSSLTDSSTETFWESGDEDRNKTKSITLTCSDAMVPVVIAVHIDNSRDIGGVNDSDLREHMVGILFSRSKLTHLQKQVCAHIVQSIRKEASRVKEEWENSLLNKDDKDNCVVIALSDAYCFELLSMVLALSGSSVGRVYIAQQVTLIQDVLTLLHTGSPRVQRQVASILRRILPEITPQQFASNMGISSLPPTDISILTQSNKSQPSTDDYVGILDILLACMAKALTVQVKVKGGSGPAGTLGGKGVCTLTVASMMNPSVDDKQIKKTDDKRWWLKGSMAQNVGELIIKLLKDMSLGLFSEAWSRVTKGAVAELLLALTKLEEGKRLPTECMKTHTMWLSLASLCVLDQEHVERLSSGQWVGGSEGQQSKHKPTCDNHDDNETLAIILCNMCGNLCADCDRFLHLHRKTKSHQRQVFKEEEESIKVDLHEGCGRTKLFWVMTLADSKTLKAMVEFKETGKSSSGSSPGYCRFCSSGHNTGLLPVGYVCSDPECQEHAKHACIKTLPCGHQCGGIINEDKCLPCLHGCKTKDGIKLKQDGDDMCMVCFTEALSAAPAVQAYYGGEARCDQEVGGADEYDPSELVCGGCSDVSRAQMCPKHGTDYLEYKCRYCCSVAVFFCFGTTHFCNACHDDFQRVTSIAKSDLPHCPA
uniref:Probable E3 ubiquitin-protein ligase MYCBP2 n=1 Tax=Saccoglossus kowalevskii TaxID=10224 RepID=A0ABM0LXG7_SACKO